MKDTVVIENSKTSFEKCFTDTKDIILEHSLELVIGNRRGLSHSSSMESSDDKANII